MDEDPLGDRAALRRLAAWLLRFAPVVALDEPDGLLADVTGCAALFGLQYGTHAAEVGSECDECDDLTVERAFLVDLHARLRRFGITARVAIAGTVGAAWGVSRFATSTVVAVPHGGERDALSPLPIEALRFDAIDAAALREVQVERVHQVLALERGELADRFAHATRRSRVPRDARSGRSTPLTLASTPTLDSGEGDVIAAAATSSAHNGTSCDPLRRIDQAFGSLPEPLHPVRLAQPCRVERVFAGPVSNRETIEIAAADLVQRLCRRLKRRERGARTVRLEAIRSDASPVVIDLHLGCPSRRRGHLWSLLAPRLETLHMGFGVDALVLSAPRVARSGRPQVALPHGQLLDPTVNECIDVLVARFGPNSVMRPVPAAVHEPEGFARLVAAADAPIRASVILHDAMYLSVLPRAERPTALWPVAEAITVESGIDGSCGAILWRGHYHTIVSIAGGERIDDRWWIASPKPPRTRLYRRALLDIGLWLWIWLDPATGRWYAQGAWI